MLSYTQSPSDGLPGYSLPLGYKRLYGPWLTFVATVPSTDPAALITAATATAMAAINASLGGLSIISDPLYPTAAERFTVTGTVRGEGTDCCTSYL